MQLSRHFTLAELTRSATADRMNIDNSLDPKIHPVTIKNLVHLAENVLEPIRLYYALPLSPNSGYRSYDLETVLCSAAMDRFIARGDGTSMDYLETKQHPKGEAVDIQLPGVSNLELARWIADDLESFDQLILEFYKEDNPMAGWVHVSIRTDYNNRREVLTIGESIRLRGLPGR